MSQVAYQAGAHPAFSSMNQLGVFLLRPGWDASPSQGYPTSFPGSSRNRERTLGTRLRVTPSIKFAGTHLYTWVERGTVRVKCLAQENTTQCHRPGLEPGPLATVSSALTMRPSINQSLFIHEIVSFTWSS